MKISPKFSLNTCKLNNEHSSVAHYILYDTEDVLEIIEYFRVAKIHSYLKYIFLITAITIFWTKNYGLN